jgi:ectoine hydroxylase-related dioxygenase (phytanoyl-CoA dioxygenase family)
MNIMSGTGTFEPFDAERTKQLIDRFNRDGFVHIPNVLSSEEVEALKRAADRVFADPRWDEHDNLYGFVAVRLFETDPVFEEMLTREPIISLVEEILGKDCHLVAENLVRNEPGKAIDRFHVDDLLIFPLPPEILRFDPRITMPVHILTVQLPLTDIPSVEYGPSEYVPGSHYSGREPDDPHQPVFEGRGPVPVLCRAGDVYLHNGQCWHRGAPNRSDRLRYLFQLSYSRRWVSQRFFPFVNYQLPQGVYERADDRRRRVLGFHRKGAYG